MTTNSLAEEIKKTLEAFHNATDETIYKAVIASSDEAVNKLHSVHVPGSEKYGSWDAYNASWAKTKLASDRKHHFKSTVHNVDYYRLTHLLENGHAMPQGGRSRAYPHIAPIAEEVDDKFFNMVKDGI